MPSAARKGCDKILMMAESFDSAFSSTFETADTVVSRQATEEPRAEGEYKPPSVYSAVTTSWLPLSPRELETLLACLTCVD